MKKIILSLLVIFSLFSCEREIINDIDTEQYATFPNFKLPEGKTTDIVLSKLDDTVFELDVNLISRFSDSFESLDVVAELKTMKGAVLTEVVTSLKTMPGKVSFTYSDLQAAFGSAVDKKNLAGSTLVVYADNMRFSSGTIVTRFTEYKIIEQQEKEDKDGNKLLDKDGKPILKDVEVIKRIDNYSNDVIDYVIFNPTISYSILGDVNEIESGDYTLVGSYFDEGTSAWVDTDPAEVKIAKEGRKMTITGRYLGGIGTLVVQKHFGASLPIEGELVLYDLGPVFIYTSSTSGKYNLYSRTIVDSEYTMDGKFTGGKFTYTSTNKYFEKLKYTFTKK
ncbi:hypothetical protein K5X82_09885 [Halosquirtibacter xylanolyticus]|uniref:hypothetical protein n=1 Tax=Halosquirtibacter xylanolyticus TaxID=3374599 RepID=UPI00374782A1|nr:hypothetical protein K5X82_09885 [Prolixibacteraceae bacterium]